MVYQGRQYYLHGLGPFTPFYYDRYGKHWAFTSSNPHEYPTPAELEERKLQIPIGRNHQLR